MAAAASVSWSVGSADRLSIIVKFMLMVMLDSVSISALNSTNGDRMPRDLLQGEREGERDGEEIRDECGKVYFGLFNALISDRGGGRAKEQSKICYLRLKGR